MEPMSALTHAALLESRRPDTYSEHGEGVYFIVARYGSVLVLDVLALAERVWLQALAASLGRPLVHFLQVITCC